jgi:hypothetical protein
LGIKCPPNLAGVDFWIFFDFQYLTAELGLAKEFEDQSRKGVFLYFHISLCGMSFWGPKKRKVTI